MGVQTAEETHWAKIATAVASLAGVAGAWWKLKRGMARERVVEIDAIARLERRLEDFMDSTATQFSDIRIDLEQTKRRSSRYEARESEHFEVLTEQLDRME